MDINNLFEELEQLKKEVWYLIKKTIPKLEELIHGSSSSEIKEIKNQLQTALSDIENLKSQITLANGEIDKTNENLSSLQNDFQSLSSTINSISQSLTNLQQEVNTNSSNILNLTNSVSNNLSAIESLTNEVSSNSSKITQNENSISSLQNKVTSIEGINSQQDSSIASLTSSINSLTDSIANLQTEIESAKKEKIELIYDMYSTDEKINFGYTSGATGGSYFVLDFTKYHSLRIFARLQTSNVVTEIKVLERKIGDITLTAAGGLPSSLYFLKVVLGVAPLYNRLQVGTYAKYVFSTSGTFTLETGNTHEYFYIYRIEGIIK